MSSTNQVTSTYAPLPESSCTTAATSKAPISTDRSLNNTTLLDVKPIGGPYCWGLNEDGAFCRLDKPITEDQITRADHAEYLASRAQSASVMTTIAPSRLTTADPASTLAPSGASDAKIRHFDGWNFFCQRAVHAKRPKGCEEDIMDAIDFTIMPPQVQGYLTLDPSTKRPKDFVRILTYFRKEQISKLQRLKNEEEMQARVVEELRKRHRIEKSRLTANIDLKALHAWISRNAKWIEAKQRVRPRAPGKRGSRKGKRARLDESFAGEDHTENLDHEDQEECQVIEEDKAHNATEHDPDAEGETETDNGINEE
jgi:hypothetical protein